MAICHQGMSDKGGGLLGTRAMKDDDQQTTWEALMAMADRTQDLDSALIQYKRAADLAEQDFGPMSATTGVSLLGLAHCFEALGKRDEAEPLYQRIRAILTKYAIEIVRETAKREIT